MGKSRKIALAGTVVVLITVTAFLITCTFVSAWVFGLGKGSTTYSERWRSRLAPLPDPTAARSAYPEIEVMEFANGEWVFGVSSDSHGSHWGGTVVVKDSEGRIRTFFGHVCGPGFFDRMKGSKNLADFYVHKEWVQWEMQEYKTE